MSNSLDPGPEVIKLISYSTQLSMKFILLISVKMSIFVGILTFISMINTTSERLKARHFFICWYFSFYEQSVEHKKVLKPRGQIWVQNCKGSQQMTLVGNTFI